MREYATSRLPLVLLSMLLVLLSPARALAAAPEAADRAIDKQLKAVIAEMKSDPAFWNLNAAKPPVNRSKGYDIYNLDVVALRGIEDSGSAEAFREALVPAGWEYPLIDQAGKVVSAVQVSSNGSGLEVSGQGLWVPADLADFASNERAVRALLAEAGVSKVESLQRVRAESLHSDFVYVTATDGEFVIPVGGDSSTTGLTSKTVYSARDAVAAILVSLPVYDEGSGSEPAYSGAQSAALARDVGTSPGAVALLIAACLSIAGVGLTVHRRRHRCIQ